MKTIKKIKKSISILLAVVVLTPTIISCSKQSDSLEIISKEELSYKEMFSRVNFPINELKKKSLELNKYSKNSESSFKEISDIQITQELIDEYAEMMGFETGLVTLDFVESVIAEQGVITNITFDNYISNLNYDNFTKSKLIQISVGNTIQNLEEDINFQNLPLKERDLLLISNTFENEFMNLYGSDTSKISFEWDTPSFIVGAGIVSIAGGFGWPVIVGGLVAVLVYNVIGWITGK